MCVRTNGGVLQSMSVVIGICGTNFCTFWADGRRVVSDPETATGYRVDGDDHYQKIFKLNDRVLFGASGVFLMGEDLRDPVNTIADLSNASVKIVKNAVVNYLKTKHDPELIRNYLVGGKERDGAFVIYEITWDIVQRKARVVERRLKQSQGGYAISMSLPIGEKQLAQKTLSAAQAMVQQASNHEDLKHKMASVIYSISRFDDTVGPAAISLTIT